MRKVRLDPQALAAAGVVAVLAAVAVLTAHKQPPPYEPYASTDYRAGGYRAWAALLAREGFATERFVLRPVELDDRIDTLVSAQSPALAPDAPTRTAADVGALAAWVRAGGRLVYVGRDARRAADETRFLELPFLVPDVGARGGGFRGPAAGAVRELARLGTNRMLFVEHAGATLLADRYGDIAVRYPLGRGEVVAVVDGFPFTNGAIGRADNARLAYLVALPRRPAGVIAFDDGLHGALIDRPWYRALPVPLRLTLGIMGVALLLTLAGGALRGAAPMRLDPPREPSSAEFVDALAALHERTAARATARAVLAQAAFASAARGVGLAPDAAPGELLRRLGEGHGAANVRLLAQAIEAPAATDADLLASAQLAYRVRKDWTDGGIGDGSRAAFAGRPRTRRRR